MKYLLDTNIIVALTISADENVIIRAAECDVGDMVTSSIALAEVAEAQVSLEEEIPRGEIVCLPWKRIVLGGKSKASQT